MWAQQRKFGAALAENLTGPLPYNPQHDLPFGQDWNGPANYGGKLNLVNWAGGIPSVHLATVIELPYAMASGVEVNAETARAFGRDIARGIREYWRCFTSQAPPSRTDA